MRISPTSSPRTTSIEVDTARYVGNITHWPTDRFEFDFLSRSSGNVVFFGEAHLPTVDVLAKYWDENVLPAIQASLDAEAAGKDHASG